MMMMNGDHLTPIGRDCPPLAGLGFPRPNRFLVGEFLDAFSPFYKRMCQSVSRSVRPSVNHTRAGYLRNWISGLNLNKIAPGT